MNTKIEYMHVLTQLPTQDLQEMFDDELWDKQIRQKFALFPEKHAEWEKDWANLMNKELNKIMGIRGDD